MRFVVLCSLMATLALPAIAAPSLSRDHTLPAAVIDLIATQSQMSPQDVHPLPGGAVIWSGGVLGAVALEDSNGICAIYNYQGSRLDALFMGVPCTFQGPPTLKLDRNTALPDVVYKISLYLPNRGAMANHQIAFYYDAQKDGFCESQSLARWYETGNKSWTPDLSDGNCSGLL